MRISGSVIEVGAMPFDDSLPCRKSLQNALERIGINRDGPYEYKGIHILKGHSNSTTCISDTQSDVVQCNAVLEHDKYFRMTLAKIQRVMRSSGLTVIGTPGYQRYWEEKIQSFLQRIPLLHGLRSSSSFNPLFWSTITYRVHDAPGDYCRFSRQSFRDAFFAGM